MTKSKKILLGCLSTIVIIIIAGYFGINYIWKNISFTDCEQVDETYVIGEYEIIKYSCLGPVGPPYYPLDLHKNGEKIANNGFEKDSCIIKFNPETGLYLYLNICDKSIKEIRPNKKMILLSDIDSALIYSKSLHQVKKLSEKRISMLVKDWNKSMVSDFRDKHRDSIFYPDYHYKLILYNNNVEIEFLTFNDLIGDESKWVYRIKKERDKEYFDKIWNE